MPDYQAGQFASSTLFKAQCQNPRTGTDPATSLPFVDRQGTTLLENRWLRSWSNETYLWYDEIQYQNPASFNNPDKLTLPRLKPRREQRLATCVINFIIRCQRNGGGKLTQAGSSSGYGAEFALVATRPPRDIRIAYVQPNSPAATAGLKRGDKVLTIDGVDAVNGNDIDTLNAGLFPSANNQSHRFVFQPVTGANKSVTLVSQAVVETPVLHTAVSTSGH